MMGVMSETITAMGAPEAQEDLGAQEAQEVQEAPKEQEDRGRRALDSEAISHAFSSLRRPLQQRRLLRRERTRS